MDYNSVTQFISTVGFPIAMSCALLWYIYKQSEKHREESKEFAEALNNNTLVLQKLSDMLEILRKE